MAAVFNYLANKLIDHMRGVASYTMPTVYLGLVTTTPTASAGGTECSYTGYARVALSSSNLSASASGSGTNSAAITFGQNTSATTQTATYWQTFDASTGGNLLEFAPLSSSLAISQNVTPSFAAGTLTTGMV